MLGKVSSKPMNSQTKLPENGHASLNSDLARIGSRESRNLKSPALQATRSRLTFLLLLGAIINLPLLLFAFGPISYSIDNGVVLYPYVIACNSLFLVGFGFGCYTLPRPSACIDSNRVYNFGVAALLVLVVLTFVERSPIVSNFGVALDDPGAVYNATQEASLMVQSGKGKLVDYIAVYWQMLLGPLIALVYPMLISGWSQLSMPQRALGLAAVGGNLFVNVAMTGASKFAADAALLFPFLLWIRRQQTRSIGSLRQVLAGACAVAAIFLLAISFFGATVSGRPGEGQNITKADILLMGDDPENLFVTWLPAEVKPAIVGVIRYMTHGFNNLSLCLGLPFEWTYGVGNSLVLTQYAEKLAGEGEIFRKTYPGRAEQQYGYEAGLRRWHTIYPWLASDFTFPGVVVVMAVLGWVFSVVLGDAIGAKNPIATSLACYFLIMTFYFSANNQVLQNSAQCVPFLLTILWWWATRGRYARAGVTTGAISMS